MLISDRSTVDDVMWVSTLRTVAKRSVRRLEVGDLRQNLAEPEKNQDSKFKNTIIMIIIIIHRTILQIC